MSAVYTVVLPICFFVLVLVGLCRVKDPSYLKIGFGRWFHLEVSRTQSEIAEPDTASHRALLSGRPTPPEPDSTSERGLPPADRRTSGLGK